MGQNGSRSTSPEHVTDGDESKPSVPGKLRRRSMFHRRSHKKGSDSSLHSVHSNDFAGIVCIESISVTFLVRSRSSAIVLKIDVDRLENGFSMNVDCRLR